MFFSDAGTFGESVVKSNSWTTLARLLSGCRSVGVTQKACEAHLLFVVLDQFPVPLLLDFFFLSRPSDYRLTLL
jgi:hypothetical protein